MKEKQRSNQIDMLNGSLWDKILRFAIPLAASSILQQLFNSADVAVVGRFAGSEALAAVGGNSSVVTLLINLFIGVSVGANVVIANYIGQNRRDFVQDVVHTTVTMAILSGFILLGTGIFIARPLLQLMNTPSNVLDLAVLYLRIYFLGMPFMMIYNFGSSILRSVGDTKRPLLCLIVSGIINVCLNLFLVVGCHLDVAGVAIATVTANGVSAALVLYFLTHEEGMLHLDFRKLTLKKTYLVQVVRIGVPAGVQGVVFSLSNVCIQSGINSFGSDAVAGSAAAVNFEFFVYFVTSAFSQAAVTFVSQNYGAQKFDRCRRVFRLSLAGAIVATGIMCAVFLLTRNVIIRIYTTDPDVIDFAMIRMTHVILFSWLPPTYEVTGSVLRGLGYSALPAALTVIGSCGLRILWIYTVFNWFNSFEMLVNVYPISWILTGGAVILAYFIVQRKAFRLPEEEAEKQADSGLVD